MHPAVRDAAPAEKRSLGSVDARVSVPFRRGRFDRPALHEPTRRRVGQINPRQVPEQLVDRPQRLQQGSVSHALQVGQREGVGKLEWAHLRAPQGRKMSAAAQTRADVFGQGAQVGPRPDACFELDLAAVERANAEPVDDDLSRLPLDVLPRTGVRVVGLAILLDRKSTRLNSSHSQQSRMPSSA